MFYTISQIVAVLSYLSTDYITYMKPRIFEGHKIKLSSSFKIKITHELIFSYFIYFNSNLVLLSSNFN